MKTKHFAVMISAFALIALLMGKAYATFDSHVHTGNGTIDTNLSCSPYDSHKLRVFAPAGGRIDAYTWKSGVGTIADIDAQNGNCATDVHNCSYDNILFSSWVSNYTSGTGKAYLADANNVNLPNCTPD